MTSGSSPTLLAAYAKYLYQLRRKREATFGDLFGEPAWDILLDLYISESAGQSLVVSSVCIAACVPASTALRWIGRLVADGVLERRLDPFDKRRRYIAMTSDAFDNMSQFLHLAMRLDPSCKSR